MVTLTPEMFTSLTTGISGNANVLLPVGLTIMGIMVGIGLIPKIIYRFL